MLQNLYGFILLKENRHQDAITKFKKSIDLNPKFFEGFYNLGTCYLNIADYENSLISLLKALELEKIIIIVILI